MVYAYRLKKTDDSGRVIEGFGVRRTWQYSSDAKVKVLEKWAPVVFLEAGDIKALKSKIDEYEKNGRPPEEKTPEPAVPAPSSETGELSEKLNKLNLTELKQYAKDSGFPEAEYSAFTRSRLIDYLLLAASPRS